MNDRSQVTVVRCGLKDGEGWETTAALEASLASMATMVVVAPMAVVKEWCSVKEKKWMEMEKGEKLSWTEMVASMASVASVVAAMVASIVGWMALEGADVEVPPVPSGIERWRRVVPGVVDTEGTDVEDPLCPQ